MTKIAVNVVGTELNVDTDKLTDAVRAYIMEYGLKQMLNDSHASVTATTNPDEDERKEAKLAMAEKKLASLMAGNVAQARFGGGDPIRTEMRKLADAELTAALKAAGKKLADAKKAKDAEGNLVWTATVNKLMEKHEARYKKEAQARLDKAKGAAEGIDLEGLFTLEKAGDAGAE